MLRHPDYYYQRLPKKIPTLKTGPRKVVTSKTKKILCYWHEKKLPAYTDKSLSEALILGSSNPQYEKRLFIDSPVQYMKTTSSEHVVYTDCFLFLF